MTCKWKTVPLGDVLELVIDHRGKTPKKMGFEDFHDSGYPVLSAKHVKTSGLAHLDTIRYANQEMYDKWMKVPVEKGDVVLTSEAPMGETFYIDGSVQYLLGQRVFGLRPKEKIIEPLYLQAWLSSGLGQSKLQARATGSTVQGIKQSELLKIDIELPPLSVQRVIARNQFNFSKKIELNQNINQTLEQIAQALFKSWFVDFDPVKAKIEVLEAGGSEEEALLAAMQVISSKNAEELAAFEVEKPEEYAQLRATAELFPSAMVDSELGEIPEGWLCLSLDEIAHYQNGLALQRFRPEDESDFLPVVKIAQLRKGAANGEEKASPNINPACIIDNGDIIFSWSGSLIVDVWCGGKAALNQHLFKVTSEDHPKWFYYLYTKHHLAEFQRIASYKAVTMGHIKRSHLKEALCAVPKALLLNKANNKFQFILDKKIELKLESLNLSQIRDTLLPKLLSGELDVSELVDSLEAEA